MTYLKPSVIAVIKKFQGLLVNFCMKSIVLFTTLTNKHVIAYEIYGVNDDIKDY